MFKQFVLSFMAKSNVQGASWSGENAGLFIAIAVVAVIVVIVLLAPKCVESEYQGEQYICTKEWDPRWEPVYESTRYESTRYEEN